MRVRDRHRADLDIAACGGYRTAGMWNMWVRDRHSADLDIIAACGGYRTAACGERCFAIGICGSAIGAGSATARVIVDVVVVAAGQSRGNQECDAGPTGYI